jgi:hypothetical protein
MKDEMITEERKTQQVLRIGREDFDQIIGEVQAPRRNNSAQIRN